MLIDNNSLLNRLPNNLEPKQALILDGIRTCTNIIEESTRELYRLLFKSSFDELKPFNYRAFVSAWTIIDNSYRLNKLLIAFKKLVPVIYNLSAINDLKKAEELRHTFQHLDERIEQIFIKEQFPIFGQISWVARKNITDKEGHVFCMVCGYYPYKTQSFIPVNPIGKNLRNHIDLITIRTIGRVEKKSFRKIELTIESLLGSIKVCLNDLEKVLQANYKLFKPENSNDIDLIYIMKFQLLENNKGTMSNSVMIKRRIGGS